MSIDFDHLHRMRLVGEIRTTGQAFRELFALLEGRFDPDSFVDNLAFVLCQRLDALGEQLEELIKSDDMLSGIRGIAPARGQGAGDRPLGAGEGLGTLRAE